MHRYAHMHATPVAQKKPSDTNGVKVPRVEKALPPESL